MPTEITERPTTAAVGASPSSLLSTIAEFDGTGKADGPTVDRVTTGSTTHRKRSSASGDDDTNRAYTSRSPDDVSAPIDIFTENESKRNKDKNESSSDPDTGNVTDTTDNLISINNNANKITKETSEDTKTTKVVGDKYFTTESPLFTQGSVINISDMTAFMNDTYPTAFTSPGVYSDVAMFDSRGLIWTAGFLSLSVILALALRLFVPVYRAQKMKKRQRDPETSIEERRRKQDKIASRSLFKASSYEIPPGLDSPIQRAYGSFNYAYPLSYPSCLPPGGVPLVRSEVSTASNFSDSSCCSSNKSKSKKKSESDNLNLHLTRILSRDLDQPLNLAAVYRNNWDMQFTPGGTSPEMLSYVYHPSENRLIPEVDA